MKKLKGTVKARVMKSIEPEEADLQEVIDAFNREATTEYAREQAFRAIESERAYQDSKWGNTLSGGRPGNGERTVDEFVTYIVGYSNDLLNNASHFGKTEDKLNIIRKVAGLCVACMEQHGAPQREGFKVE